MAANKATSCAFAVLLCAHLFAAVYAPIQDCDETYNFWEPSHYLNHGYGLQTWELSPVYAIRSWLYASIHSMVMYPMTFLNLPSGKAVEFYGLRCVLALVCAACESRLFYAAYRSLNPRVAIIFAIVCTSCAGIFHASVSYLPSSFVMYTTALALADFTIHADGRSSWRAIVWLALGTIVGWPFVGALALPIIIEQLVSRSLKAELANVMLDLIKSLFYSLLILAIEFAVDSVFYRKWTSVPFNIVRYNVLSSSGNGPDIYGTEPWHFYIRNLLINFNIWSILALLSLPLLLFCRNSTSLAASGSILFRNVMLTSPFYLWLCIFTLQPHKEERFMYPIYPCVALNSAIALHIILVESSDSTLSKPQTKTKAQAKLLFAIGFILAGFALGILRSTGIASAYSAPLSIYDSLHLEPVISTNPGRIFNVCVGKEWYRFPSSYHLPPNARLKFIKSDFRGLLPGEFDETSSTSFGPFPATWIIPSGMNDENIEDEGKYINLEYCDFLVDSYFPEREASPQEPDFILDQKTWEQVKCSKFLDANSSRFLARLFWIPDYSFIPSRWRRHWGDYCLLRKRS